MRYWITTHWPQRKDETPLHTGVWVTDEKRSAITLVRPGDLVAIYEGGSGPASRTPRPDGSFERRPRRRGRQGVVEIHRVTGPVREPDGSEPETYWDESTRWWRWHAATRRISSAGFVFRTELASLLGMSSKYVFRGFGEGHSGLKEVGEDLFDQLLAAYRKSDLDEDQHSAVRSRAVRGGPGGGEGPAHKALKLAIAADPSSLGEKGLELVKVEFGFPTGDRIDVLLCDRFGCYVAVEVEGDCDEFELAGPLQCMKYRALVAYFFERPEGEVRSILAAPSIHSKVSARLERYGVESREVGPAPLSS